jgi:hypothetical protein
MTTTFEAPHTASPGTTLADVAPVQVDLPPVEAAPVQAALTQAALVQPAPVQAATPSRYQSRPGRGVMVAPSLADLRGPAEGTVELPLRLFWSCPGHTFDLGDPDMRLWLYQTVLREASRPEDLATYLDGDTLIALWPDLFLPAGVRQAWEDAHPLLRATAAAF